MITTTLRNEIKATRNEKLANNKEMFEMGLIGNYERFSLDFEANKVYKKEISFTK